jgi:hypothetical protein
MFKTVLHFILYVKVSWHLGSSFLNRRLLLESVTSKVKLKVVKD